MMELTECKDYLRKQGIEVSNLSEATIRYLCEEAFEDVGTTSPPDINAIDPATRVKAGIQQLDDYVKALDTKSFILNLISDAIEMNATKENKPSEP